MRQGLEMVLANSRCKKRGGLVTHVHMFERYLLIGTLYRHAMG